MNWNVGILEWWNNKTGRSGEVDYPEVKIHGTG